MNYYRHTMSCPYPEGCNCCASDLNRKDARIRDLKQRLEVEATEEKRDTRQRKAGDYWNSRMKEEFDRANVAERRIVKLEGLLKRCIPFIEGGRHPEEPLISVRAALSESVTSAPTFEASCVYYGYPGHRCTCLVPTDSEEENNASQ